MLFETVTETLVFSLARLVFSWEKNKIIASDARKPELQSCQMQHLI